MSRYSPTVNFSGVSPVGQGLASLSDAFLRAYQLRQARQDADANRALQARRLALEEQQGQAKLAEAGYVPPHLDPTTPTGLAAISNAQVADANVPGAFDYNRSLAAALVGKRTEGQLAVQDSRNAGALARTTATNAAHTTQLGIRYGNYATDPTTGAITYTPGVQAQSSLFAGQPALAEHTRHDKATEANARDRVNITRNSASFRQSTAGQITPKDIYRRGTALMAPQTQVNPDAPYAAAAMQTPGLPADSAMARAATEAATANRAFSGARPPAAAPPAPATSFGFNAAPNPFAPPPAASGSSLAPHVPRSGAEASAPATRAPGAQTPRAGTMADSSTATYPKGTGLPPHPAAPTARAPLSARDKQMAAKNLRFRAYLAGQGYRAGVDF